MNEFNETQTGLKTGEEHLVHNGEKLGHNLLGFWRWTSSDLLSTATRGRLAEFIVTSATNVDLNQVRAEWKAIHMNSSIVRSI